MNFFFFYNFIRQLSIIASHRLTYKTSPCSKQRVLLDVTRVCEPKENISSVIKYGEY
jgi:hypothetical protein